MSRELDRFQELLVAASAELYQDNSVSMRTGELLPTSNVIDPGDVHLFWTGVDLGLIGLGRGGRFNTLDRPTADGRWGLLSRGAEGGWYNAEYLPQIAAYVDAIVNLGYPAERVLFELPGRSLQLDLAILDDTGRVVVLGEAKREIGMLEKLRAQVLDRFADAEPADVTKKRGDEARQLAWRLWTVQPEFAWLIAPGQRQAYRCAASPLQLDPIAGLPRADELGLEHRPPRRLSPPDLTTGEASGSRRSTTTDQSRTSSVNLSASSGDKRGAMEDTGVELYRAGGGQKLHIPPCPHVHNVELSPATQADRDSLSVCSWCQAELDGHGRTYHSSISDALEDLEAPHSSRPQLAALLTDVDHDSIHVPYSRSYVALVKNGKAVAWAGKTYVAYQDGSFVPLPDYAPGGGGGTEQNEVWGEMCPVCFTARSISGSCLCS